MARYICLIVAPNGYCFAITDMESRTAETATIPGRSLYTAFCDVVEAELPASYGLHCRWRAGVLSRDQPVITGKGGSDQNDSFCYRERGA